MTAPPSITVASYNVRKAIGTDRRRNPQRVLDVLHEMDADVVALQEADKRFGGRGAAVPHELIDEHGLYKPVYLGAKNRRVMDRMPGGRRFDALLKVNTRSIGWHGNAILVKQHIGILDCAALELPTFEPRGAVMAELLVGDQPIRVVGMHLDLSGLLAPASDPLDPRCGGAEASEHADDPDGRHQRVARRRRLPQGLRAGLPYRPDRPELPFAASRWRRSTGSSSTRTFASTRRGCT